VTERLVAPTLWHYAMSFLFQAAGVPLVALFLLLPGAPLGLAVFLALYGCLAALLSARYALGVPVGGTLRDRYGIVQDERPFARLGTAGRVAHALMAMAWLGAIAAMAFAMLVQ
jgi:hypothetical protein